MMPALAACWLAASAAWPSWQVASGYPRSASYTTTGQVNGVAVDAVTGGAYAVGWQQRTFTGASRRHLLRKYGPGGDLLWTATLTAGPTADADARAVAADALGNAVVAGSTPPGSGGKDWLIQKFSPAGALLWATTFDDPAGRDDAAFAVAVDGSPAQLAVLTGPWGLALAGAATLFVADPDNARVRVMDLAADGIDTAAGTGDTGYNGDGIAASAALTSSPTGVAADPAGNLYVADTANHRVRRVDALTGLITTVAGTGVAGYNGDSIAATAAQLASPRRVAVSAAGDLYVADTGNHRVRKVDAVTGVIATVAGTGTAGANEERLPALLVQLNAPVNVATDPAGSAVWVAEAGNRRIRRIDLASGLITAVAGTGAAAAGPDGIAASEAGTAYPFQMAVDAGSNLFFADALDHRVRRVDAVTCLVSTVAGTGAAGFNGDGIAATAARLNSPYGVAIDVAGNLFVADSGNGLVRRVDAVTKLISTVAGDGVPGFTELPAALASRLVSPRGLTVSTTGALLLIADAGNHRIREADAATGLLATVAGTTAYGYNGDGLSALCADTASAYQAAWDAAGNVYIADSMNHRVRRVDAATGAITTFAGTGAAGYNGEGPAGAAQLSRPSGLAVDPGGTLYIADTDNHRIRSIGLLDGVIATVAGTGTGGYNGDGIAATGAQLNAPLGVGLAPGGTLFVADTANHRVRRVDPVSGQIDTLAGDGVPGFLGDGLQATAARLFMPAAVAVDGAGTVYVADTGNHRIRAVDAVSGSIATFAGTGATAYNGDGIAATAAALAAPAGVAADLAGNVWIADTGSHRVRRVDAATGLIATVAGTGAAGDDGDTLPATAASLNVPLAVGLDAAGNLYLADFGNQRIRVVSAATGRIATLAGTGLPGFGGDGLPGRYARLDSPTSLAVQAGGTLFVADELNHRIRRIEGSCARVITTVAGTGAVGGAGDGGAATAAELNFPAGVAVDAAGHLAVADSNNARVRRIEAGTGLISTIGGTGIPGYNGETIAATAAQLDTPGGVALDGATLYVADAGSHRVRRVDGATGRITTVAGQGAAGDGPSDRAAACTALNAPDGLAVGAGGTLVIADRANHRVRLVPGGTGVAFTVAGTGVPGYDGDGGPATAARLAWPADVAADAQGNVYVADTGNHAVRRLDAQTGAASSVHCVLGYQGFGGNIYAAGRENRGDLGQSNNWAVAKFDAAGALLWCARYDSPAHADDQALGIAVDSGGSVYVAGYETRTDAAEGTNALLRKYAPDGTLLWSRSYNSPGSLDERWLAVAADPLDASVVAAGWEDRADLAQGADWLVRKYAADGTLLWSRTYNHPAANAADRARGVAVDGAGNVIVCGEEKRNDLSPGQAQNWLVRAYDPGGTLRWARDYNADGVNGDESARAAAADALGRVLIGGDEERRDPVGGLNWIHGGAWRVVRYDAAGNADWVAPDPVSRDDGLAALGLDQRGWAWAAGNATRDDRGTDVVVAAFSATETGGEIAGFTLDRAAGDEGVPALAVAGRQFDANGPMETDIQLAYTTVTPSSTLLRTDLTFYQRRDAAGGCATEFHEDLTWSFATSERAAALLRFPDGSAFGAGTVAGAGPEQAVGFRWLRNPGATACLFAPHRWTATVWSGSNAALTAKAAASDGRGGAWVVAESGGDLLLYDFPGTAYADSSPTDLKMTPVLVARVAGGGTARANAAARDAAGRLWVGGASGGLAALWRFEPDGAPSPGFPRRYGPAAAFRGVAADESGRVYAVGASGASAYFVAVNAAGDLLPGAPLTITPAVGTLEAAAVAVEPGGAGVWIAGTLRSGATTWSGSAGVVYRLAVLPDPPRIPPGTVALRAPGGAILNLLRGETMDILAHPLEPGEIRAQVLTQRAELVREFSTPTPGHQVETFTWDGRNAAGEPLASGTYAVRIVGGGLKAVKRMVVIRRP